MEVATVTNGEVSVLTSKHCPLPEQGYTDFGYLSSVELCFLTCRINLHCESVFYDVQSRRCSGAHACSASTLISSATGGTYRVAVRAKHETVTVGGVTRPNDFMTAQGQMMRPSLNNANPNTQLPCAFDASAIVTEYGPCAWVPVLLDSQGLFTHAATSTGGVVVELQSFGVSSMDAYVGDDTLTCIAGDGMRAFGAFASGTPHKLRSNGGDGRVDDGDCDESKRAVYSNWGEGQPIASSQDDTTDLASALFEASVHDCVALNVLAGSRCALLVGDDGDDARSAACAIGMRVVFGEWSALPCDHVKPYACADAEGNNLQIETKPMTFDEARTRCAAMGMILAPPPGDAIANRNLAVQAHAQLCDAHVLQPYSSSACDSTTSPEIRRAVPSWSNSLPGGVQVGESGYANCTEPGAFVRVKLELQHNLTAPTYVLDLSPDACDADSHERGSLGKVNLS
ncbi:hypothetical protein CYMTET_51676 [Cymbomonas tetramitiformis]|uniref:Uncharacterized protein n=1 Tax=Cymbomonas tetramitiformis TaxID=36881 RepID=A0AAE0ES35_9CHLO|nr:hypothetical protein CYMTET_51676 [Cymbomonas tetramitiformis]